MRMTDTLQRLREWTPLLPLLLLLAGTYWLNQQVQPLSLRSDGNKRHDPDFIIDRISATTLNENGTPHFLMSADKVVHYPDDDSTHLDQPRLNSLSPGRPPVYTSSDQGEVSSKGDEIYLHGTVRIVRAASATQSEMTFATDYLHVVPDLDTMDTDRPVTLTDAHDVVQAVGMKYDSKAQVVNLLSQVRSQHEIKR